MPTCIPERSWQFNPLQDRIRPSGQRERMQWPYCSHQHQVQCQREAGEDSQPFCRAGWGNHLRRPFRWQLGETLHFAGLRSTVRCIVPGPGVS